MGRLVPFSVTVGLLVFFVFFLLKVSVSSVLTVRPSSSNWEKIWLDINRLKFVPFLTTVMPNNVLKKLMNCTSVKARNPSALKTTSFPYLWKTNLQSCSLCSDEDPVNVKGFRCVSWMCFTRSNSWWHGYKWRLVLFLRERGASSLPQVLQRTSWVRTWSENDSAVSWSPLGRVSSGQCSDGSVRTQNGLQLVCLFCLFGSRARMCWRTGDTRRNDFIQGGFAVNMYSCVCVDFRCVYMRNTFNPH